MNGAAVESLISSFSNEVGAPIAQLRDVLCELLLLAPIELLKDQLCLIDEFAMNACAIREELQGIVHVKCVFALLDQRSACRERDGLLNDVRRGIGESN